MRKRLIITSICLLALGSCATGAPHYYNKPGVTLASYKETEQECIEAIKNVNVPRGYSDGSVAGAIGAGIGRGIAQGIAKRNAYETCMINNGYEKVEISREQYNEFKKLSEDERDARAYELARLPRLSSPNDKYANVQTDIKFGEIYARDLSDPSGDDYGEFIRFQTDGRLRITRTLNQPCFVQDMLANYATVRDAPEFNLEGNAVSFSVKETEYFIEVLGNKGYDYTGIANGNALILRGFDPETGTEMTSQVYEVRQFDCPSNS